MTKHYGIKFPLFLNNGKISHMPQVTKRLIYDSCLANVKTPELADKVGGERFPR